MEGVEGQRQLSSLMKITITIKLIMHSLLVNYKKWTLIRIKAL